MRPNPSSSFPRKREPSRLFGAKNCNWLPAFAGTTKDGDWSFYDCLQDLGDDALKLILVGFADPVGRFSVTKTDGDQEIGASFGSLVESLSR